VWTDREIDIDLDQDINFSLDFHQQHSLLYFLFFRSIPLATMNAAPDEVLRLDDKRYRQVVSSKVERS
jgi:hypothetical protein